VVNLGDTRTANASKNGDLGQPDLALFVIGKSPQHKQLSANSDYDPLTSCRKKMKRVERRGTQDAAALGQHVPLGSLASATANALNQPQLSPRQSTHPHHQHVGTYPPPTPGYPREAQYADSHSQFASQQHQREYQFQTPLSATSSFGRNAAGPREHWDASQRSPGECKYGISSLFLC
jgi:hypothetical protein